VKRQKVFNNDENAVNKKHVGAKPEKLADLEGQVSERMKQNGEKNGIEIMVSVDVSLFKNIFPFQHIFSGRAENEKIPFPLRFNVKKNEKKNRRDAVEKYVIRLPVQ